MLTRENSRPYRSTRPRREASQSPARASQFLVFARNFLKYPKHVGWVLPSSRFLVEDVLRQIDWQEARTIVEYGPGLGAFTARVLERMRPDARLIALEINPEFIRELSRSLPDPRLHLVEASAADVDAVLGCLGVAHADYVISGIPFSTLPPAVREVVVQKTHAVLRPQGGFLVYQVSGAVRPHLERVFGHVSRDFRLLNTVPIRLFFCAR